MNRNTGLGAKTVVASALSTLAISSALWLCLGTAVAAPLAGAVASEVVNRIDLLRGDAPELAAYGDFKVGVRTLDFEDPDRVNAVTVDLKAAMPNPLPRYTRPIKVEVWYPADPAATGSNVISAMMRDASMVKLQGKAIQDAKPNTSSGAFPLVIVSHGYPGNRHLLAPIADNLASKGYVVVAIDHVDSTYNTLSANGLNASMVHRPLDQLFVLNKIAALSKDSSSFLNGLVNAGNTAIIGYSMGGYGALVSAGAGVTQGMVDANPLVAIHQSGSASHERMKDARIKTTVTFAPAGLKAGWIDLNGLKEIKMPMLFIAGSEDATVGYEDGVRGTWKGVTGVDRSLLTFQYAGHNVGAPMSPPAEAYKYSETMKMPLTNHYLDQVWDNLRMNNISEHFITAWLGKYLKGDKRMDEYMNLPVNSDANWKGFPAGTAKSLKFEKLSAGQ